MTKILYSENEIRNNMHSHLKNGIEVLNGALSTLSSMSVPGEFSYYSYLTNLPSVVRDILAEYRNIDNWFERSLNDFEATSKNIEDDLKLFSPVEMAEETEKIVKLH